MTESVSAPLLAPPQASTRARWPLLAKILISVALVALLYRRVSFADAAQHLLQVKPVPLLAAFGLLGMSMLVTGVRWHLCSVRSLPLAVCVRFTWIAHLYGMVLPGALSADVAKGVVMTARGESSCAVTLSASIILDRVAGLGTMIVLGLVCCHSRPELLHLAPWLLSLLALAAGLGMLLLPAVASKILAVMDRRRRLAAMSALFEQLSLILWLEILLLSLFIHGLNALFYLACMEAVGGNVSPVEMLLYSCLLNLALILPISIGGIGLREQLAVAFIQIASAPTKVAFGWLVLFLSLLHAVVGLVLQLRSARGRAVKQRQRPV